jgi:hypothetical protein
MVIKSLDFLIHNCLVLIQVLLSIHLIYSKTEKIPNCCASQMLTDLVVLSCENCQGDQPRQFGRICTGI